MTAPAYKEAAGCFWASKDTILVKVSLCLKFPTRRGSVSCNGVHYYSSIGLLYSDMCIMVAICEIAAARKVRAVHNQADKKLPILLLQWLG